jgi:hypothetical protein
MKRYLAAILAILTFLTVISSAQVVSVKQLGQQLVTSLKFNPPWEVVQCDETPGVLVGKAKGYRLVLRQTTGASIIQNGINVNEVRWSNPSPAKMKSPYIDLVLFKDERRLPENALAGISWLDLNDRYYVKPVDLGSGYGYRWFGKLSIFWQEMLREKMNLTGGDDRLQLLDEGLRVKDEGGMTQNSMPQLFSKYGDKALPYLKAALNDKEIAPSNVFSALARIATPKATDLLNSLYNGNNTQHSSYASGALTRNPRVESKAEYLDMLRKQSQITEVSAIVKKFGWQSEAKPILEQICAEPRRFYNYRSAFEALRDVEGRSLNELIAAEKQLLSAAFPMDGDRAKHASEIEQAKAAILAYSDKKASAVIALSFANPAGKGNTSSFETVIAAGRELFGKMPTDVTKPILDSLRHMDKEEVAKLRKVAPEL